MKLSTIFKAVTVVSTIATVGLFAYSKTREAKKIKMVKNIEDTVEPEESENTESVEKVKSELSNFTTKEKNAVILGGTLCGLTGGLIVYATLVPICCRVGDCLIVYKLVQKATANGNLTIEELIDLAYNRGQEVA